MLKLRKQTDISRNKHLCENHFIVALYFLGKTVSKILQNIMAGDPKGI